MNRWIIGAAILALVGIGIGWASRWSQLGLLDRLDSLYPGHQAKQMGRNIGFGRHGLGLDIWVPAVKSKNAPVIIFFYGGSWKSGFKEGYGFLGRALAARGFVVVIPDYRKVPEVRFPAFVEDAADAVAWTSAHIGTYGGDPGRIAVSGHSAGAHIAAMLTLDPQWLGREKLPVKAIRAFAGLAGPYDFYPFTSDAARNAFGHEADPKVTQPITYASASAPPMLLLTGTADTTVKPRNSQALAKAIGDRARVIQYQGVDHIGIIKAVSRPFRDTAPVVDDMAAFLNEALKQ